jgi:hypothetical protein
VWVLFLIENPEWQSRRFGFSFVSIPRAFHISKRLVLYAGRLLAQLHFLREKYDFSSFSPLTIRRNTLDLPEGLDYIDAPTVCPRAGIFLKLRVRMLAGEFCAI